MRLDFKLIIIVILFSLGGFANSENINNKKIFYTSIFISVSIAIGEIASNSLLSNTIFKKVTNENQIRIESKSQDAFLTELKKKYGDTSNDLYAGEARQLYKLIIKDIPSLPDVKLELKNQDYETLAYNASHFRAAAREYIRQRGGYVAETTADFFERSGAATTGTAEKRFNQKLRKCDNDYLCATKSMIQSAKKSNTHADFLSNYVLHYLWL